MVTTERSYVHLTKLREIAEPSDDRQKALTVATNEGAPGHHVGPGYVVDGWFLEAPQVGRSMVLLRFRRNGVDRLGVFTSSPVTVVGESEIHTENSIYGIEERSFDNPQSAHGAGYGAELVQHPAPNIMPLIGSARSHRPRDPAEKTNARDAWAMAKRKRRTN